jgi:hypothetical protein
METSSQARGQWWLLFPLKHLSYTSIRKLKKSNTHELQSRLRLHRENIRSNTLYPTPTRSASGRHKNSPSILFLTCLHVERKARPQDKQASTCLNSVREKIILSCHFLKYHCSKLISSSIHDPEIRNTHDELNSNTGTPRTDPTRSIAMEPIISTPRLKLTLVTTAERGSLESEWLHEIRSDEKATWWRYLQITSFSFTESLRFLQLFDLI